MYELVIIIDTFFVNHVWIVDKNVKTNCEIICDKIKKNQTSVLLTISKTF